MKILMLTPYVTLAGHPEFERNKTGFGYMVMDIARAIGKSEKVDLLATDTLGAEFEHEGVSFLKRSARTFLFNLFRCLSLKSLFQLWKRYRMSKGTFIRLVYYWFITGYVVQIIKSGSYDIVHIHGCGFGTDIWIRACQKCNQKYLITLHGLNSFSDTVPLEPAGKKYERDFLKRVIDGELSITVISTGIKKLIEREYNKNNCDNIFVVSNSFSFTNYKNFTNIRNQYGLAENSKIIICVGNVCPRKNQNQLIKAFQYLPKTLALTTYILFIGDNSQSDYNIEKLSENNPWKTHMISVGIVPKENINPFYEQCDAVALMSLSEGFGLSLIEGMHFGKPCISFNDIDAFDDIYNPCAMIGVDLHNNEAVANGIRLLIERKWDSNIIRSYSQKFESQNMARNYCNVYERILSM